jgi:cobalt-zinc-cadmium efflux system membrane fusion protein
MNQSTTAAKSRWQAILSIVVLLAVIAGVAGTYRLWLPRVQAMLAPQEPVDPHAGHDHGSEADAGDENTLKLSEVGWQNIGLKTAIVKPQTYLKTISVPAIVVERPGLSQVEITAKLTGIVTRVYPMEGQAIKPGDPLFDLQLTHEDVVTAQRDFLRLAQELDVIKREIDRLEKVGEGVIAGRRVLEHKYEQQKTEAAMYAQSQGLLLHGLSQEHVDAILSTRQLRKSLTVVAPAYGELDKHADEHIYHVQKISVKRGQHVSTGDSLGVLGDHCELYVEGQAFEDDSQRLLNATNKGWLLDVVPVRHGTVNADPLKLKIFYVADHVETESRALNFYLELSNHLIRDEEKSAGQRFVAWEYRPGQRMEVKIPLGQAWKNQIVLPPAAIAQDGAEAFVFRKSAAGKDFIRVPVHILYRGQDVVVVENTGKLVGRTVAISGAYDMHLALKNKAGGGVDPHAGHSH